MDERTTSNGDLHGVLTLGTRLRSGSYSIGKLLGRGGFGITYMGADNRLVRPVALKEFFPAGSARRGTTVIRPPTLSSADYATARQRFLQEAQVMARFHHPGIVAVYEVFEENATAYMVMEYVRGETLEQKMERCGKPLAESELLTIIRPLAEALDVVHAGGILHRDIKPANIMVANDNGCTRPVLIDFGAARNFVRDKTIRQSVILTVGYAPLEQYAEHHPRGAYTDIYALAATLYHLSTGVPPPAATDLAAGMPLEAPRALNPQLSTAFSRAILHGLETRPDRRPQSAREFFEELVGARRTFGRAGRTTTKRGNGEQPALSPAPSGHLLRIHQIARDLAAGGAVQTDKLVCPVCRTSNMFDPAKAVGKIRCPVCRAAGLQERLAVAERDRCPACHDGRLKRQKSSGLMHCPACRVGVVTKYVKRRMLFLARQEWATCDTCGADFDFQPPDRLTLVDLPGGPGELHPGLKGRTMARDEWMRLSGRTDNMYVCDGCDAEFDSYPDGRLQWVTWQGRLDQVPPEHRGQRRTQLDWTKVAHGFPLKAGTHACPNCRAQFDETHPGHLALLRAAQDPYGVLPSFGGRTHPVGIWRSLAAGKRDPARPGLICPACTAELWESPPQQYSLGAYDPARDAYGVARRYYNKHALQREDWQRIAAGRLPTHDEQQLREEAQQELWAAMVAGEYVIPEAEQSYPTAHATGEKIVLELASAQFRETQKEGFHQYDTGKLWVTTQKLVYHGNRIKLTVPLDKISGCFVRPKERTCPALVAVDRLDRAKTIYFNVGTGEITTTIGGLSLKLCCDSNRIVELIKSLRTGR